MSNEPSHMGEMVRVTLHYSDNTAHAMIMSQVQAQAIRDSRTRFVALNLDGRIVSINVDNVIWFEEVPQ